LLAAWIPALAWFERSARAEGRGLPLRFLGAWLVLALLVYAGVQHHAGEYGWWPLVHISFLEKEAFPSRIPTDVDWAAYRALLGQKASEIPGVGYFLQGGAVRGTSYPLVWAGFATIALALRSRAPRPERLAPHAAILLAMLVAYLVRWFLFPQLWDRFFTPLFVLVPLLCLSMVGTALARTDEASPQSDENESTPSITSS
jgi:hypothetical protein